MEDICTLLDMICYFPITLAVNLEQLIASLLSRAEPKMIDRVLDKITNELVIIKGHPVSVLCMIAEAFG